MPDQLESGQKLRENIPSDSTYFIAAVNHDYKAESVRQDKKGSAQVEYDPHAGSLDKGSVKEDASSTKCLGLGTQTLQAKDKETVSVVHSFVSSTPKRGFS